MEKISAIVQTYNAEEHLDKVLESLKPFDEIIVVDMESTDRTVEIARKHGAKVEIVERGEHRIVEAYRNYAIGLASHPWVLVVDADEIVPTALAKYLYNEINADPTPRGFYLARKNYFMGRWLRNTYPNHILRFFPKEGTDWPYIIHSQPSVSVPVSKIPRKRKDLALVHLANEPYKVRLDKLNVYTDYEMPRKRPGYKRAKMFLRPLFWFIKSYFIKGGIFCGYPGLVHACWESFYQFSIFAKLEEERRKRLPREIDRDMKESLKK